MTDTINAVIAEIETERRRQVADEGWTPEHDDTHVNGEMAEAAACYAIRNAEQRVFAGGRSILHTLWPWSREWWAPKNRRRDLIRAAALIVAEIERLDRAEAREIGR
jgi:hypothetical protein